MTRPRSWTPGLLMALTLGTGCTPPDSDAPSDRTEFRRYGEAWAGVGAQGFRFEPGSLPGTIVALDGDESVGPSFAVGTPASRWPEASFLLPYMEQDNLLHLRDGSAPAWIVGRSPDAGGLAVHAIDPSTVALRVARLEPGSEPTVSEVDLEVLGDSDDAALWISHVADPAGGAPRGVVLMRTADGTLDLVDFVGSSGAGRRSSLGFKPPLDSGKGSLMRRGGRTILGFTVGIEHGGYAAAFDLGVLDVTGPLEVRKLSGEELEALGLE